jgi:hypothetical protein
MRGAHEPASCDAPEDYDRRGYSRSVRHSRPLVPAVALVSILLMGGIAAAATKLTPANSFPFEFAASSSETLAGTGCGTTATGARGPG